MNANEHEREPWRHDADGYAYKRYMDAAGQPRRQYADKHYLNALEARAADASISMAALAGTIADERDENRRLKTELAAAERKLAAWHEAMTDVSVINWTLSEENVEDLHKQLVAVIAQNVQEQLDPVVSEQAAKLQDAERGLAEAKRLLERAIGEIEFGSNDTILDWVADKDALLVRLSSQEAPVVERQV